VEVAVLEAVRLAGSVGDEIGVIGTLLFVVVALIRGWLVPGWAHRREQERGDKALDMALRGTDLAGEGVRFARRATDGQ